METPEILKLIGLYFISPAAITGFFVYLGKTILDNTARLQMEKLKHEHQVQFSSIYKEKAVFIRSVYNSIYDLEVIIKNNIMLRESKSIASEQVFVEIFGKVQKISENIERNRIYFNKTFSDKLIQVLSEYRRSLGLLSDQNEINKWTTNERGNFFMNYTIGLSELREELAKEFGEIIGS